MKRSLLFGLAMFLCAAAISFAYADGPATKSAPYAVADQFPIAGDARWDYITVDSKARRLYVTNGTRIAVLDADSGKSVGEVKPTPGIHGIALDPDHNMGFATNGQDATVSVFDLTTFKTLNKVKASIKPDAIVYDPASKLVFACNGKNGPITVIDPAAVDEEPRAIAVTGKLEFAVVDGKGRLYVNVEDKNELVAIDTKTLKVEAHWSLAPGEEPTGLAIDVAHRRLFAGCSGNQKMIVLDADSGKVLAVLPIGKGVDGVAFDPVRKLAISANGQDGTATVIAEKDANTFEVAATVDTVKSARTIAYDEHTGQLYLPCNLPAKGDNKAGFGVLVLKHSEAQ